MKVDGKFNGFPGTGTLSKRVNGDKVVLLVDLRTQEFSSVHLEIEMSAPDTEELSDQLAVDAFEARLNAEKMAPVAGTTST